MSQASWLVKTSPCDRITRPMHELTPVSGFLRSGVETPTEPNLNTVWIHVFGNKIRSFFLVQSYRIPNDSLGIFSKRK